MKNGFNCHEHTQKLLGEKLKWSVTTEHYQILETGYYIPSDVNLKYRVYHLWNLEKNNVI